MNALLQRLATRIALAGPITVADFMSEALGHASHGYYRHGDPLGAAGDFVTAPEISQVFGELIGAWLAERWQSLGSPAHVHLVELGPGRGTLMADALRATRAVPGFHAALDLHLVEINPTLREMQRRSLGGRLLAERQHWHDALAAVPDDLPLLLVANEFVDALPIRQLQRTAGDWRERLLTVAEGKLRFVLAPGPSPLAALLDPGLAQAAPGAIAELCLPARSLAQDIAGRLKARGGAALLIDYGSSRPTLGDSLQAVAGHRRVEILADPGDADLSAHVDFAALAAAATAGGARAYGPVTQADFLRELGIELRRDALIGAADATAAAIIAAGVERLIAPAQMGTLFKALALCDPQSPPPAGFSAAA